MPMAAVCYVILSLLQQSSHPRIVNPSSYTTRLFQPTAACDKKSKQYQEPLAYHIITIHKNNIDPRQIKQQCPHNLIQ